MVSKRRNSVIANMFHEVHFVEKWGRGIGLILNREPDVEFEVVADIFITRFKRKNYMPSPTQKTGEKTREKIIALIQENQNITIEELAKTTSLSTKGIEWNLKRLKEEGILKRVGGRKTGHWEIINQK